VTAPKTIVAVGPGVFDGGDDGDDDAASFIAGSTMVADDDGDDTDGGAANDAIIWVAALPPPAAPATTAPTAPTVPTAGAPSTRAPQLRQNLSLSSRVLWQRQQGPPMVADAGGVVGADDDGEDATDETGAGGVDGDGAANDAAPPSAITARSTFFMANWVERGWPLGGVIHDGGADIGAADGEVVAGDGEVVAADGKVVGGAGAAIMGSERSEPTSRGAPQVTQLLVPGSL
jgi:hypothetical protein